MYPIFVIKFSGVSDLQGVKVPGFPLTSLVIVTTVLRYRAACDASPVLPVSFRQPFIAITLWVSLHHKITSYDILHQHFRHP